jgi:hypothetical protein
MGKKSNALLSLLLVIATVVICYLTMGKRVPEGYVLVKQATVDSLRAYVKIADSLEILANQPPDTIKIKTIEYRDTTIVVSNPTIEPDPVDSTLLTVRDSLIVKDTISAWVEFKVRGYMETPITWGYVPITVTDSIIIEKTIPYPVIETVEISKSVTGHYLSLVAQGNDKMFIFGIDYDLVREQNIYGLQYRRFGDYNIYGVKVGIKLNNIFKKIRNGP